MWTWLCEEACSLMFMFTVHEHSCCPTRTCPFSQVMWSAVLPIMSSQDGLQCSTRKRYVLGDVEMTFSIVKRLIYDGLQCFSWWCTGQRLRCPLLQARWRGVQSCLSFSIGSHSSTVVKYFTTYNCTFTEYWDGIWAWAALLHRHCQHSSDRTRVVTTILQRSCPQYAV